MKTSSLLVLFCVCIAAFTACTNSADYNTPRTITTPIANDTTRPLPGGPSALRIASFTPATASSGTVVTILGSSFRGTTVVSFGGAFAQSFTVVSDSVIIASVGSGATGNVSVTTPIGTTSLGGFTFISGAGQLGAPTITGFTPTSGGSGRQVTIIGTDFRGATSVNFGGVPATSFIVLSPTQIVATIGAGASGNVSVTTPSGTASAAGFTFIAPPTIISFTPISAANGAVVTINGTNFINPTQVQFGGIDARSFTVVSLNQITAIVSSTGATGNVSVTTRGGTASLAGFIFLP